jgi:hypothetical protein
MSPDKWSKEEKYQLVGWGLFVICACLFLVSSIKVNDPINIAASLFFLVACFVFMIPYFWER